jgi:hypothetical protein
MTRPAPYPPTPAWQPTGPQPPAPPSPPGRDRRWARRLGVVGLVTVAVAGAVAITYVVAHAPTPTTGRGIPTTSAPTPSYSSFEQDAAKERVCRIFQESTRGLGGQGGLWVDGVPNQLVILRTVGGVVALQDTLNPSVPGALAETAHKYISVNLELVTTALDTHATIDDVRRLTDSANAATDEMLTACR